MKSNNDLSIIKINITIHNIIFLTYTMSPILCLYHIRWGSMHLRLFKITLPLQKLYCLPLLMLVLQKLLLLIKLQLEHLNPPKTPLQAYGELQNQLHRQFL